MDNRAVALKLIMNHLDIDDISSVDQRMEVQKAIYLAQASGLPLGYSYGWYVKGPYSPTLTRDYYGNGGDVLRGGPSLKAAAVQKLDRLKQLMEQPIGNLTRPRRLELLASLHFLIKSSGYKESKAKERLVEVKPHLADGVGDGLRLLREYDLL